MGRYLFLEIKLYSNNHTHVFTYCDAYFCKTAELSHCNRNVRAHKAENDLLCGPWQKISANARAREKIKWNME